MFSNGLLTLGRGDEYNEFYRPGYHNTTIDEMPVLPGNLYYNVSCFAKTVDENVKNLQELINAIKKYNSDIEIYFVLLPRYYIVEKYHEKLLTEFRVQFESIINKFIEEEKISLLNYKNCTRISTNHRFYIDPEHLGYHGAIAFSTILNRDICTYERGK